jgi:hypothetical protein
MMLVAGHERSSHQIENNGLVSAVRVHENLNLIVFFLIRM